jgi:SAM-dependent methyltransferase
VSADPPLRLSFGRVAELYHRVRPPYSQEALDLAQEALRLTRGVLVLDLAAGTGRLTHELALRFAHVVAVEPNDEMRGVLAGRSGDIRVLAGTAERMPLPDEFADAVFVGDAFHWFDGEAAVAEIARVVRPGGGVALLWNHWWSDGDDQNVNTLDPPLPAEAQTLLDEPYVSSGRAAARANMADPLVAFAGGSFGPLVEEAFPRTEQLSGAEVVDLYATVSAVASLRPEQREELKRSLRALLAPSYQLEITTVLHWTRRA